MKILKPVLACLGLLAWASPPTDWTTFGFAPSFEHVTVAQGLSQATVFVTLQDRRGFLWFGTEDGLNRYDGTRFTVFRHEKERPDSLGANWISSLLEDRHGHLWIGTMGGGLARMHATTGRIQRFLPAQGLPSANINCLTEDRAGNLWVGTFDRGLAFLDVRELDRPEPSFHPLSADSGLPGGQVQSLLVDGEGVVWVGLKEGGLSRLRNPSQPFRFEAFRHDSVRPETSAPLDVTSLAPETGRRLWVGSARGLYLLDIESGGWKRFVHRPNEDASLCHNHVWRLYRDRANALWVGTDGGGLDRMLPRATPEEPPRFQHFRHDPRNPYSLSNNPVDSIFEDRSGVLWVGTYTGGLNKLVMSRQPGLDRARPPILHYRNNPADPTSLQGNQVMSFVEDRWGSLWVGHNSAGLSRVRPPEHPSEPLRFEHIAAQPGRAGALQENYVLTMHRGHRGSIWLGTVSQGLVRMDISERSPADLPRFTHFTHRPGDPSSLSSNFVFSILEDRTHRLWVGTVGGGLNLMDPVTGHCRHFRPGGPGTLSDENVYSIVEDRHGMLWIAGMNGLSRMNPATGAFKVYRPQDLPGFQAYANINQLCLDRDGHLWMATNGGGLNRCTVPPWTGGGPEFEHFDTRHGLPGDLILGVQQDDLGRLWLSTHKGLCLFDPKAGRALPMPFQPDLRGVEYLRCASYRSTTGQLFFGSNQGFVVFRPEGIAPNPIVPPVVFTDFQLSNQPVPVGPVEGRTLLDRPLADGPDITLTTRDRVISFQFAALHFVAPERNAYAYKLEGLDTDWNSIGNRTHLTFTTLPPGDYTLRVKGSNSDGIWNHAGASLRIRVRPQWWQSWWFRIGGLALIAVGLVLQVRRRERRLRIQNQALEARVAQRTEELAERNQVLEQANLKLLEVDQLKAGFTAMLVHDVRSPLSGIRASMELFQEEGEVDPGILTRCLGATDSILAMLNDLLDVFRSEGKELPLALEPLRLGILANLVAETFEPLYRKKDVALIRAFPELEDRVLGDPVRLERALGNLLSNALKFTPGGGTVRLELREREGEEEEAGLRWLTLRVQDSGRGIPPEALPFIFDPYRQVQRKDANMGAGLGLAIVQRILAAHRGRVTVRSQQDVGTSFMLWFPKA